MSIKAIIYRGPDADLSLPIQILRAERIHWQIEDADIAQMLSLMKGKFNPRSGWAVWLPAFNDGASTWTGIYQMLEKRGLLLC
jgi:hypothetical protein